MHTRTRRLFAVLIALSVLLLWGVAQCATAPQQQMTNPKPGQAAATGQYVGSDTCKTCHEDVHNKFQANPHSNLLKEQTRGGIEYHGCESCHGPGAAHVEGGGDKTKIIDFKILSPEEASKRCMTCHGSGVDQSNFARSVHLANGVGCTSCHSIHGATVKNALLQQRSPVLCYQCHTEQRAEFSRPYRHRVNENLLQCSDCHNVHGGFLARQLRTSNAQDQVCFKCHTDTKGPFVYEHLPVKTEGCVACHMPHGSTNPRLLRVSQVNLLCLQCHTLALSNVPSAPPIGPAHNQAQKYQACTLCHQFIHGSNFSEVFFKP